MGSMEDFVIWGTLSVGQAAVRARPQDGLVYGKMELSKSSWYIIHGRGWVALV